MGRTLETDRLLLRPFRPEDRADCFAFLSDPETCHLDGGPAVTRTVSVSSKRYRITRSTASAA